MRKPILLLIIMFVVNSFILYGCADNSGTVSVTVKTTEPVITYIKAPTLSSSPSYTPITTTPPEETAGKTVSPEKTLKPTPSPASQEDGKVTIADGFYYYKLNDKLKKRITGMSYPKDTKNAKIKYDDLRYIRLKYYDFDGKVHDDGELIVNKKLAKQVTKIFYELYKNKYQFTSIKLVDDYGEPGDDNLSMAANNTSAFNYRKVTGSNNLSRHSYGAAIDINPMMNPYIVGKRIAPPNGKKYADRSLKLPGMIDHGDLCFKLFKKNGWAWGGDFSVDKDYQHFSIDIT